LIWINLVLRYVFDICLASYGCIGNPEISRNRLDEYPTEVFLKKKDSSMNLEQHFAPIAALDLEPIKVKLMLEESGEGWSPAYADAVEFEYRRFLYLVKKFPSEPAAPLFDVDVFWHYHILDTMKYAADCEQVFGYFLHHSPYSGRGEDDEIVHQRNGARMQELYEATFGEACIRQEQGQAIPAGSLPTIANIAWCTPATAKTAWCSPAKAQTAWCSPATAQTAWCSPATAKTAWCSPATAKIAWCSPARPETASSRPNVACP
jgi:hypothetical protein